MLNYFEADDNREIHTEDSLNHLKNFLSKLNNDDSWENPHVYKILEYFPIGKPKSYIPNMYELLNLKLDTIEDGFVIFDDGEGILEESMYDNNPLPLHSFCLDSVIYVGFQNYYKTTTISFDDGYIKIYY